MNTAAVHGRRVALVIGNSNYGESGIGSLPNPVNDARLVAAALRADGFDVDLVLDADQQTMKRAISRLGQRTQVAGSGATSLFYYAGHGLQSRGVNFLVPVRASIDSEADVDIEAVAADAVVSQMQEAVGTTSIIILDACRNTPILRRFRSGSRGLARMDAPTGAFISYSTAPGSVAADGEGANSPYAKALAVELTKPGQPIEAIFRSVRKAVLTATEGQQTPWDSSSLTETFVFKQ